MVSHFDRHFVFSSHVIRLIIGHQLLNITCADVISIYYSSLNVDPLKLMVDS